VLNLKVDKANAFDVYHSLLELCVKNTKDNTFHRVMLDRGSHESTHDTWNSRIRFINLGTTTNCDAASKSEITAENPDSVILGEV